MLRPDHNYVHESIGHDPECVKKIEKNLGAGRLLPGFDVADEALHVSGPVTEFSLTPALFEPLLAEEATKCPIESLNPSLTSRPRHPFIICGWRPIELYTIVYKRLI